MLEYTSRQVTQLVRQYDMFLKSLNIITNDLDKEKIYMQMDKIKERILIETNNIYEEKYMMLLGSTTYLISEEKERLLCLIKLIEERIEYVKKERLRHKEITGNLIDYPKILGEDKLGEFRNHIKIIDKFNENKKKENALSIEINELDSRISEAIKKIKNNKNLNTTLEKKMIGLLSKMFDKLGYYELTKDKDNILKEYDELEFSLNKAKDNVKKAKLSGKEDLIIECESLLTSVNATFSLVKEKKYILKLMEVYDNIISDYEQLLSKREEMNDILNEIQDSHLYSIVGEELTKQYNTIKIEKQDMNSYESLISERENKYEMLEKIVNENNSKEFMDVLDDLLVNEKKRQEELMQEQRKHDYEERQRRLIEEKRLEDERRKRQQLIIEERKKEQETLTKKLLEQQRKTVIKDNKKEEKNIINNINNTENVEKAVSFNSVLEKDMIPIIKNNNLVNEEVGKSNDEIKKIDTDDIFMNDNLFPEINS